MGDSLVDSYLFHQQVPFIVELSGTPEGLLMRLLLACLGQVLSLSRSSFEQISGGEA